MTDLSSAVSASADILSASEQSTACVFRLLPSSADARSVRRSKGTITGVIAKGSSSSVLCQEPQPIYATRMSPYVAKVAIRALLEEQPGLDQLDIADRLGLDLPLAVKYCAELAAACKITSA